MAKSILTEYEDVSAFSPSPSECTHHLVFGSGLRELSEKYGLKINLTNSEHNASPYGLIYQIHENHTAEILSKMLGQVAFEKEYYRQKCGIDGDPARDQFLKIFGKRYL